ncbi:MAG: hypothetical protein GY801_01285 [bacterium]|nr:hypothetical protein [bacterium]
MHNAEMFMEHGEYVEASVTIDEASRKAHKIELPSEVYHRLIHLESSIQDQFVHVDESSLMQVFKNRQIPIKQRQALLYAFQVMLYTRSLHDREILVIDGVEYDGALVQMFTHPQISWWYREFLVITIEEDILKQEPGHLRDVYWRHNREFLDLWEHYQQELKANYSK